MLKKQNKYSKDINNKFIKNSIQKNNGYYMSRKFQLQNPEKPKKYSTSSSTPMNIPFKNAMFKTQQSPMERNHKETMADPNQNINLVMSLLENKEMYQDIEQKKDAIISKSSNFQNARQRLHTIAFKNHQWTNPQRRPRKLRQKKTEETKVLRPTPKIKNPVKQSGGLLYRTTSQQDNYVPPKSQPRAMDRKYSHRIITKKNQLFPYTYSLNTVKKNSPVKPIKQKVNSPYQMSGSKSQNQLKQIHPVKKVYLKKSQSSSNINQLKNDSSFSFSNKVNPSRISKFHPINKNSTLKNNLSRQESQPRSVSRSRSRKINLDSYKITRLDKSTKSIKKFGFDQKEKQNLIVFSRTHSGFPSVNDPNSKFAKIFENQQYKSPSKIKQRVTPQRKRPLQTQKETTLYQPQSLVRKPSQEQRRVIQTVSKSWMDAVDVETKNLESDHLESSKSKSKIQRSYSTSGIKSSAKKMHFVRDHQRKFTLVSASPNQINQNVIPFKRSVSTNLFPKQSSNMFSSNTTFRANYHQN
jgi:hypothetical protein